MTNSVAYTMIDLTPQQAMDMFKTDWWVGMDKAVAAKKQLFTTEMIMPFEDYYQGLKQLLGRDVHRAEVQMFEVIRAEYLGLKTKPSGEELEPVIKAYGAVVKVSDERE